LKLNFDVVRDELVPSPIAAGLGGAEEISHTCDERRKRERRQQSESV
jgi:hypothetical protein